MVNAVSTKYLFSVQLASHQIIFMLLIPQSLTRNTAMEIAVNVKALHNETESLLVGRVPLVS